MRRVPEVGRKTAAALLVLAVVVAGLWFVDWRQDRAESDRATAAKTAVASMKRLLSFKPSTVKAEVADERGLLTGSFAEEYDKAVVPQFDAVVANKVTTVAQIPRAGVEKSSGGEVVVLLFANTTRTSPSSDTRISGSRMRVTMKKVDGDWRISDYKSL